MWVAVIAMGETGAVQAGTEQAGPEQAGADEGLDAALTRIGDRWSLLVVSALFAGPHRFNQLQEELGGIATNVLSQRLKNLEALGVVVATPYSTRPPRYAYELTASGHELAGAVRLLTEWGAARSGGATQAPLHGECGTSLEARWYCPTCSRTVADDEPDDAVFI
jgi:DNA-binding HxlR family transcriptional regulator